MWFRPLFYILRQSLSVKIKTQKTMPIVKQDLEKILQENFPEAQIEVIALVDDNNHQEDNPKSSQIPHNLDGSKSPCLVWLTRVRSGYTPIEQFSAPSYPTYVGHSFLAFSYPMSNPFQNPSVYAWNLPSSFGVEFLCS